MVPLFINFTILTGPFNILATIIHISCLYYSYTIPLTVGECAIKLTLYVVIYAPVQMAADLPENYEGHPAFQFIKEVPTDWETSICINGEIGE